MIAIGKAKGASAELLFPQVPVKRLQILQHRPCLLLTFMLSGTPRVGDDVFSSFFREHVNGRSPAFLGSGIRFRGKAMGFNMGTSLTSLPARPPILHTLKASCGPRGATCPSQASDIRAPEFPLPPPFPSPMQIIPGGQSVHRILNSSPYSQRLTPVHQTVTLPPSLSPFLSPPLSSVWEIGDFVVQVPWDCFPVPDCVGGSTETYMYSYHGGLIKITPRMMPNEDGWMEEANWLGDFKIGFKGMVATHMCSYWCW